MEDIKYPIYTFTAKWSQYKKGANDSDLPPNRIWNSTLFSMLYKEEQTQEELILYLNDWWNKYIFKKELGQIDDVQLNVKYKEHETWVLTWFTHETFDVGQSDKEVLESFERFVLRKNSNELMGADEKWRWRGDSDNPPPCRCSECKKQGMVRIIH